jgi:hypothetical protein
MCYCAKSECLVRPTSWQYKTLIFAEASIAGNIYLDTLENLTFPQSMKDEVEIFQRMKHLLIIKSSFVMHRMRKIMVKHINWIPTKCKENTNTQPFLYITYNIHSLITYLHFRYTREDQFLHWPEKKEITTMLFVTPLRCKWDKNKLQHNILISLA